MEDGSDRNRSGCLLAVVLSITAAALAWNAYLSFFADPHNAELYVLGGFAAALIAVAGAVMAHTG